MCQESHGNAELLTYQLTSRALIDFMPGHALEIGQACFPKVKEAMEQRQKMQEGEEMKKKGCGGYERYYLPLARKRNAHIRKALRWAGAGLLLGAAVGAVVGFSPLLLAIPVVLAAPASFKAGKVGYQGYKELRTTARWVTEIMRQTMKDLSREHERKGENGQEAAGSGNNGVSQAPELARISVRQFLQERRLSP
jgi:hypothetical protein